MFPFAYAVAALGLAAVAALTILVASRPARAARKAEKLARAQRDFHRQREPLEARFIQRASARGKPRGLRWVDIDFDDDVVYALDRKERRLKALVAVEVRFEAIEGGGMEDNENVANAKAGTAEFIHDGVRWITEGKIYFNLAPSATVRFHAPDMEAVAEVQAVGRT